MSQTLQSQIHQLVSKILTTDTTAQVPSRFEFVPALPRNDNGIVDKMALRERFGVAAEPVALRAS